jgi:hypothetical protein
LHLNSGEPKSSQSWRQDSYSLTEVNESKLIDSNNHIKSELGTTYKKKIAEI